MAAGASRNQNQAIHTAFQRFLGMAHGGDVVEDLAAPFMHSVYHTMWGTKAGDDDGHLVLCAYLQVSLHAFVRRMDDQVDGVGRHDALGILSTQCGQPILDAAKPGGQSFLRAGIESRHGPNHARCTLGNHKLWRRNDEHRRTNDRQTQLAIEFRNGWVHELLLYCSSVQAARGCTTHWPGRGRRSDTQPAMNSRTPVLPKEIQ